MQALEWEKEWWGTCQNTYGEEEKQLLYAEKMGLTMFYDGKSPYNIDMKGASVLDIGGGPSSLLLKCINVKGKVVDPIMWPQWVYLRYAEAGIAFEVLPGEAIYERGWDEVWIYNVLQHTENPKLVIDKAKQAGKLIRIFECLDTPARSGHPSTVTEQDLNQWLGGEGKVEQLTGQNHVYGRAYYGVFPVPPIRFSAPSHN